MRTWTLKMTIVVLSVSMVFGMSAAYGQAVLTVETDETIYSDGNKILSLQFYRNIQNHQM